MIFGLSVTIVKLTDTLAYEELRNPNFGIKRAIGIFTYDEELKDPNFGIKRTIGIVFGS